MSEIVVENLSKRYGKRIGVEGLSFTVEPGMLFGFLGPNGSGKSTAIRTLLGFLRADSGVAQVFGLDSWRQSPRIKQDVGYVPGDLRLYPWMTCRIGLKIIGHIRRRDVDRVGFELAEEFGLDLGVSVRQMSRGMRQKLGLILAIAHEPRLMIFDEPSTGLDPLIQDRLFSRLRNLSDRGHTVFFSSHTLSEVELLCDHVAILRNGRAVECDSLEHLRRRAAREVSILWNDESSAQNVTVPPFLTLSERRNTRWTATLSGASVELVRWCVDKPVKDLDIGAPDLAGLFRAYYTADGGED